MKGGLTVTTFDRVGPVVAGECPEPLLVAYEDANGDPIDLTDFVVKLSYRVDGGAQVVRTGEIIDGPAGEVGYTWQAADWASGQLMTGEVTVGNGSNRFVRSYQAVILPPRGGTIPVV